MENGRKDETKMEQGRRIGMEEMEEEELEVKERREEKDCPL